MSGDAARAAPSGARAAGVARVAALAWPTMVLAVYFAPVVARLLRERDAEVWIDSFGGERSLPYLADAVRVGGTALLGATVLGVAAALLGAAIARALRWRFEAGIEATLVHLLLGLLAYSTLGLAAATVGAYRPPVLRTLVALPFVGAAWLLARDAPRRQLLEAARSTRAGVAGAARRAWRRPAAWFVAVALGCALVGALAPEVEYDALWYHLYFPRRALEAGRLVDLPDEYVSLYPMGWGLWFGYGLALGGPTTAKLLHFACLPLLVALVHRLARRAAPASTAWLAAAVLVSVPTVLWEATTAYADLTMALLVTLALYAVLRFDAARAADGAGGRWPWLLVAALALGTSLATKHVGLVAGAVICPTVAVLVWTRERRAAPALALATVCGLLALVPALPWYARAWVATGNPLFPELWGLLGGPAERWDALNDAGLRGYFARHGHGRDPLALLLLPWNVTMHASRYAGVPGPLLLALVPGLALVRPTRALLVVLGVALAWFALWASPLASFQLRWLLPAVPAAAVLAARGATRLRAVLRRQLGRGAARLGGAALGAVLVTSLPQLTTLHERDRAGRTGWLVNVLRGLPIAAAIGGESRDAYLARMLPTYAAWQWANAALPADARLLTWGGGDHLYAERERLFVFAPRARRMAFARPADSLAAWGTLRALGVTHLLVDERFLRDNGMTEYRWDDFVVPAAARSGRCCTRLWSDGRVSIYAVSARPRP